VCLYIDLCVFVCLYRCVYICIHVCIYVCVCIYWFQTTPPPRSRKVLHICICVCGLNMDVYMYIYIYMCVFVYRFVCVYIHVCTYVCVCIYWFKTTPPPRSRKVPYLYDWLIDCIYIEKEWFSVAYMYIVYVVYMCRYIGYCSIHSMSLSLCVCVYISYCIIFTVVTNNLILYVLSR
jgi:hypothetical protein